MESRIEKLLTKYWNGETSVREESELKAYFKHNPSLTPDGFYFKSLGKEEEIVSQIPFKHPAKRAFKSWLSAAASLLIGIAIAFAVIMDARQQKEYAVDDPERALEITRKALMMVSSGLKEGKTYTKELKKINEAEEIIKDTEL